MLPGRRRSRVCLLSTPCPWETVQRPARCAWGHKGAGKLIQARLTSQRMILHIRAFLPAKTRWTDINKHET
jgi:hypothetical protein